MAKMIKCPTCQTQIEVPAQLTGQVIKCPGCGKGLKLIAKKPAGQTAAQQPGSSVSAMTFTGEGALDDMPSLDSNCVVCGRATDPELLVEDNGRMVCPDCIKGARSRIDRPEGGAEMIGFKEPMPAPVKRTNFISMSPSFLIGTAAALIFVAAQVSLLFFMDKPQFTLTPPAKGSPGATTARAAKAANPDEPLPDTAGTTQPAEGTAPGAAAPVEGAAPVPSPVDPTKLPAPAPPAADAASPGAANPDESQPPVDSATQNDSIFSETKPPSEDPAPPDEGAAPVPPVPAVPGAEPPIAIASGANDPLAQGIEKLQLHDYAAAARLLKLAHEKHVLRRMGDTLTPEQQMTLVGLAAANLGTNQAQSAKAMLNIVLAKGQKTRSTVLNNAIAVMSKQSSTRDIHDAIELVKNYLGSPVGAATEDEYAANVFGTLLDKASSNPAVPKDWIDQQYQFLDLYNDRLAVQHPGQLKWGVEWLPAEVVRTYRANRGKPAAAVVPPEQLQKDLEAAQTKVYAMQQAVQQARQSGGDVVGAENQLNAALANLGRVKMQMDQAAAPPRPPTWLTKFTPVVPEGVVMTR